MTARHGGRSIGPRRRGGTPAIAAVITDGVAGSRVELGRTLRDVMCTRLRVLTLVDVVNPSHCTVLA